MRRTLARDGYAVTTSIAVRLLHDASCLGALVDRFAQHCHTVDIDGDSWRERNSLKRSAPRKKKEA